MRLVHRLEAPASSAAGAIECPACKVEVIVRDLRQHVVGHLKDTKARNVRLLRTSMSSPKPTRRVWLGQAYRTASKSLATAILLYSRYDFDFRFSSSVVRSFTKTVCTPQTLQKGDTCGGCGRLQDMSNRYMCTWWKKRCLACPPDALSLRGATSETPPSRSACKRRRKVASIRRALTCPSSASFAKMIVGYWSSLWQTEHAVAVAVRLNDIVALSFRVKYDMIGS